MEYLITSNIEASGVVNGPGSTGICAANACPVNVGCVVVLCGVNATPCVVHGCVAHS